MKRVELALLVLLASGCTEQPTELTEFAAELPIRAAAASAGFGTTDDVAAIGAAQGLDPTSASEPYLNQIIALVGQTPVDGPAVQSEMRDWLNLVIRPLFRDASNDAELVVAVSQLRLWDDRLETLLLFGVQLSKPSLQQLRFSVLQSLGIAKLQAAVSANNSVCSAQQNVVALNNVLFWQTQAAALGVDRQANGLDRTTVLDNLCARVELVSETLPPGPLQTGATHAFTARFRLRYTGQPNPGPAQFAVSFVPQGLTVTPSTGVTDPTGDYGAMGMASAAGTVSAAWAACLTMPQATDVCSTGALSRTAQTPPQPPPPPPPPPPATGFGGTWHFNILGVSNQFCSTGGGSTSSATLVQNGSTLSGTWQTVHSCGIGTTMSGTMSATIEHPQFGVPTLVDWTITITSMSRDDCMFFTRTFRATEPAFLQGGLTSGSNQSFTAQALGQTAECGTLTILMALARVAP